MLTSEPVLRLSSHWRTGQAWQACTLLLPDHSFSLPWLRAALRGRGFHRGGVRECDLSRVRLVGVVMQDAEIDGLVTNLVVNGVEVMSYVEAEPTAGTRCGS